MDNTLNNLKQRIVTLEKIIFHGKYSDFVFDSLLEPNAKIILCAIDGKKINIPVNTLSTVRSVKDTMHKVYNIPWWRTTYVYGGNIIHNHRSLAGIGMPADSVVYYRYDRDPCLYPPFEALTKSQRFEISLDHNTYSENTLKRNALFQRNLIRAKEVYCLEKRGHQNCLNYL